MILYLEDIGMQSTVTNNSSRMHSYIFFNKNRTSITHVGLKFEKKGSRIVLQDTYTQKEIKVDITPEMFEFLTKSVKIPFQNTSDCPENELIERLLEFMNIKTDKIISPDETFVLTQDNLTKIMAIQTRFRCQIPVVLMGETGCGKTHLIRFMCKFATYNESLKNMFILKVHGGTTEEDVIHCINEAEVAALENTKHNIDTVVFFDEANTSDVISLIKEIMCDGRCRGKLVPPFLKLVAACNPYRRHSNEMIKKIRGAKLGWLAYEEAMNDADKSREVPLRDLVYQVLELPDSMKALIFDFGKLKYETERDYTLQLTWNKLSNKTNISHDCVLAIGENECSFVSLRDVDRALVLFIYFLEVFTDVFQIEKHNNVDKITKSLLLALSVAYLARMASRNEFITKVLRCIKPPLHPVDLIEYQIIVKKYQEKLLDCIDTENGIAKNAALRENIFMMFVCIELRIPLFLVGKPGSSKSLAKAVIENSLRGKNSKKATMRQFKQIHLHSDQCSAFSTPASITEVFMSAKNFQEKRDTRTFVSVVALDIFAEASPYLPLKALHPFLEDGTDGSGSDDQRIAREKRVAFIGISNSALDPAKMNRGIMVTRTEPSIQDLKNSAIGICSDKGNNNPVLERLRTYFTELASAYKSICDLQKREFFGLRDFYSLIKMLYWMSEETGSILTRPQLEHAVRRNFSGFDEFDAVAKFQLQELKNNELKIVQNFPCQFKQFKNKDVVVLQCFSTGQFVSINENDKVTNLCECELQLIPTQDKKATLICSYQQKLSYEQRSSFTQYHLIAPNDPITNPDYSSLGLISASLLNKARILKHYIVKKCLQDFKASQSSPEGSSQQAEPFVLFGSSFPKDKEFAQVCRNISEIRLCMKNGRMVILLNLENLYESLYDVLNQYYIKSGGHRYVDLGLRSNRTKCTVHPNFKLVLIAERERVYQEFPTPLINRLEKHFVDATTVLQPWQKDVCNQLDTWIETFLTEKYCHAKMGPIKKRSPQIKFGCQNLSSDRFWLPNLILLGLFWAAKTSPYLPKEVLWGEHKWQTIVTTHTPTLSQTEFEELANRIEMDMRNMTRMHLEAFQTEQEFINSIDMMIRKGESHEHCVIFECERAHENGNLISCCRYCLTDKFREAVDSGGLNTRFVFLVHLPKKCLKSNFVSFQERPWLCYHVDAIFSTENSVPLNQILSGEVCSMSDIYYDDNEHDITDLSIDDSDVSDSQQFKSYQLLPYSEPQRINLCKRMYLQISKAASNPDQVNQLSQIIPQTILFPLSKDKITFHLQTIHLIKGILKDRELKEGTNVQQKWILDESMNMTKLQEAGTFQNAVVRKFDDIIIPIFAKIISVIDKYSNLKLLSKIETELEQLWLNLYNSDYVTQMIMSKLRSTPDDSCINATSTEQFFCQFPFCWILNDIVNENPNKDTEELITLLQDYGLFQSFESLPETTISSLARFYVHDFVHLLNTKGQPLEKDYYAMLEKCMIAMLAIPFSNELNVTSLFQIVVNVQKIYSENKSFFDLFSELIVLVPSTVHKMKSKPNDSNIEIHVLLVEALEIVLDSPFLDVKVPLMSKKEVSLQGWMQKQYESHRIIFSIVEECDIPPKVFLKWQWVCVMKLFFEYVVLQNQKETIIFARRIEKVSAKINDFEDSNALNIVAFLLSEIKKELKKLEVAKQQMIKISCWSFFLKVLSTLCIDGDIYDEELIDTLIQAVFSTTQNVKDKKLYNKIQSKLTNIMGKISSPNTQSFIGIFLANTKTKFSVSMQSEKMTSVADSLLGEGHRLLMQCKNDGALSPQCWLAVAKFTKGLEVLAKKIHESIFYMEADPDVIYLFDEAQSYCLSDDLNDDQTTEGPFWYLIRYIIRTFGSISLMRIFRNNYFKWILPSENFKDEEFIDFVAVYNPTYQDIRSAISRATTGEFDELDQAVKSLNPTFTVPLALALFERVKLSYATDIPSKKLSSE
uniref:AAA+ ATPase domain-containing protein n=1 Tax=Amphimedon queenslandica TaxID=400682 RepID=A0A1X7U225_AMPQE